MLTGCRLQSTLQHASLCSHWIQESSLKLAHLTYRSSAKVKAKAAKMAAKTRTCLAKRKRQAEAVSQEAAKQKRNLCNFVMQGKAADKDTTLAQAYNYYSSLPLRSAEKQQIANNWKKDRSCSWLNSFMESHKTTTVVESAKSSGWRTSYWIAKELGMAHDDPVFLAVLKGYREGSVVDWNEKDPAQRPFKDVGLLPYFFCGTGLETEMKYDSHEEILSSGSMAKKSKLCLTDIANEAGSESVSAAVVVVFEQWCACNVHVQAIESSLALYTVKIAEIKALQVAYQQFLASECLAADLQTAVEERVSYMILALQDVYAMEIQSMTLVNIFARFNKNDKDGLLKLHSALTEHLIAANRLHADACQWVKQHQVWLDGLRVGSQQTGQWTFGRAE